MPITKEKKNVGIKYIVGVDEVGRGPLAGPVCVGAFAAPTDFDLSIFAEAMDSKKMTAEKREKCFKKIKSELAGENRGQFALLSFAVSFIGSQKIDRLGLTKSIQQAINNSLNKLNLDPEECLVLLDGSLRAPSKYINQKTIIKGDDKEKIISLASIVAKVSRDRKLVKLSKLYPAYGFHQHKGYGTLKHRECIKTLGLTPIHRRSFCSALY